MPYVPSKKTDGISTDREILDQVVEFLARDAAEKITNNLSLLTIYKRTFLKVARSLNNLLSKKKINGSLESDLALTIYEVDGKYGYEGAYLGELNYSFTRFIQRVPQIMVERSIWKEELRYWLYACTVETLTYAANKTLSLKVGISGVFEDIKDEYKWRVNRSYEATQIIKSGDCYDTPYYGRLVEVVDKDKKHIGHMEVWLKRSPETLNKDVLDVQIVVRKKKETKPK